MKRFICAVLIIILLFSLCACGSGDQRTFRALDSVGKRQYAVMCRSGDNLEDILDAAVSVLAADGTLSYISTQWLSIDATAITGNAAALNYLAAEIEPQRKIIIGVDDSFNPLGFVDDEGQAKGLFVDVAYAFGALLGWEVRIQSFPRDELGAQLSSGNIDCAIGFDTSLVSAEKYHIGPTILESDIVVAVRTESDIKKVSQLKGGRVGTIEDRTIASAVKSNDKLGKNSSGTTIYLSASECVRAMDKGWCAAVVLDSIMLTYYEFN